MDATTQLITLGAYVKGVFDSAASRGVLTQAAIRTMMVKLVHIYGKDDFTIEQEQEQEQVAAAPGLQEIAAEAAAEAKRVAQERQQAVTKRVRTPRTAKRAPKRKS